MVLYFTIIGIVLTTIGASLIGWNDIMSENKAIDIGTTKASGETKEQNLTLPAVRELLRRSRNSKRGLSFVIVGAIFLILASLF